LADEAMERLPQVESWNADAGYSGTSVENLRNRWEKTVYISQRIVYSSAVLPKRWVVERTLA
jgi:transposase